MSQPRGRSSAPANLACSNSSPRNNPASNPSPNSNTSDALPTYLSRHIHLGFTSDDVAALISSIDSSQARPSCSNPRLAHLPAELLLQILEHVPVDYVLDWRLVCRGFRDAIDGRVLYHCLQRTELVGYMGPRHERPMKELDEEQYEAVSLLEAGFVRIDEGTSRREGKRPVWSGTHAVFKIADEWYRAFRKIGGAEARKGHTVYDADPHWFNVLDRLELHREEECFSTLRWCIRLDHAVLDMDFPVERGRLHFDVDVNLHTGFIRVAWKPMLIRFLKTERALRLLLEQKRNATFTFSHHEDCLRYTRRTRLMKSLTATKPDNTLRWALRLLHPLFNIPPDAHHAHTTPLSSTEDDATSTLLLRRRTASLSSSQLSYLHSLHSSYLSMESSLRRLDTSYSEFKSYLSMPGFQMNILLPSMVSNAKGVPRNPVAWTDELRQRIEFQVVRWGAQREVLEKVRGLLESSCEAMALPEDGFDELGSDF